MQFAGEEHVIQLKAPETADKWTFSLKCWIDLDGLVCLHSSVSKTFSGDERTSIRGTEDKCEVCEKNHGY